MVDKAIAAGCDVIKFQHHLPDREMIRGLPMSGNFTEDLYDFLCRCSLSLGQHEELYNYCEESGIIYLCTPFCKEAAMELVEKGLGDVFKIGSGEMNDLPLLAYLAENKKKMLLSTGMSTIEEIDEVVRFLESIGADFALFHCVSEYPAKDEDLSVSTVKTMQRRYPGVRIGYSCHSKSIYPSIAAVALGASYIEKHVIVDPTVSCPDQSVSITFEEMSELCEAIKVITSCMGTREGVFEKENEIREWARHTIVASCKISSGEEITENNITTKRAGRNGISSREYYKILGRSAKHTIEEGEVVTYDVLA
jgi:N-acetylneuraminate synthase